MSIPRCEVDPRGATIAGRSKTPVMDVGAGRDHAERGRLDGTDHCGLGSDDMKSDESYSKLQPWTV